MELWNNINGQNVADLTAHANFEKTPSASTSLSRLEYSNRGSQYGARIRGLLLPPQSGNFVFYIGSMTALSYG